jgi:hypothetical protein
VARKLRPAGRWTDVEVRMALARLREARDLLKSADCPQTLARVRKAITSAEGALRHATRRVMA